MALRLATIRHSPLGRSIAFAVVIALAGMMAALMMWERAPRFAVLYSGGEATDLAAVTAQLRNKGVAYKIDEESGTVMAPAGKIDKLRRELATQSPSLGRGAGLHSLEEELALSIQSIEDIERARVHLALSTASFGPAPQLPSASVLVNTVSGRALRKEQISAISRLIASAVPGLVPNRVAIIDHAGRLLSSDVSLPQSGAEGAELFLYTRQLEEAYASRIEEILTPIVGRDRVHARVSAETAANAAKGLEVKRLSVAVVLDDHSHPSGSDALSQGADRAAQDMSRISSLVKAVVGYRADRGDSLTVVKGSFVEQPTVPSDAAPSRGWFAPDKTQAYALAGLAILVLLLLGSLHRAIRGKGERVQVSAEPQPRRRADRSDDEELARAREVALREPKQVAQVMLCWLSRDCRPESEQDGMSGAGRAAILVLSLGESAAAEVLKHVAPKEVQKIGEAMTAIRSVNRPQVKSVLERLDADLKATTPLGIGAEDYLRRVLTNAVGQDKATNLLDRILPRHSARGLGALKWIEPRVIAEMVRMEHPQVIALVVSHLDSDQSAQVVSALPYSLRADVLMRVACIDGVQPAALQELDELLEKQLAGMASSIKVSSVGGSKAAADILNFLDPSTETSILEKIRIQSPEVARGIEEKLRASTDRQASTPSPSSAAAPLQNFN